MRSGDEEWSGDEERRVVMLLQGSGSLCAHHCYVSKLVGSCDCVVV